MINELMKFDTTYWIYGVYQSLPLVSGTRYPSQLITCLVTIVTLDLLDLDSWTDRQKVSFGGRRRAMILRD